MQVTGYPFLREATSHDFTKRTFPASTCVERRISIPGRRWIQILKLRPFRSTNFFKFHAQQVQARLKIFDFKYQQMLGGENRVGVDLPEVIAVDPRFVFFECGPQRPDVGVAYFVCR